MNQEMNNSLIRIIAELTLTELCDLLTSMAERIKAIGETVCTGEQTPEEIDKAFRFRNAERRLLISKAELLHDDGIVCKLISESLPDIMNALTAKSMLQEKERIEKAKKIKEN